MAVAAAASHTLPGNLFIKRLVGNLYIYQKVHFAWSWPWPLTDAALSKRPSIKTSSCSLTHWLAGDLVLWWEKIFVYFTFINILTRFSLYCHGQGRPSMAPYKTAMGGAEEVEEETNSGSGDLIAMNRWLLKRCHCFHWWEENKMFGRFFWFIDESPISGISNWSCNWSTVGVGWVLIYLHCLH